MRTGIISGLLAAGLLAGCGGAESNDEVSADGVQVVESALTCQEQCTGEFHFCMVEAETALQKSLCNQERIACVEQCPAT